MKFDPQKHHRRSIRLKDYDYSQVGAYYVTIDVQTRQCLFGNIVIVGASLVDAHPAVVQIPNPTLGDIVGAFKSITTNEYINGVTTNNWPRFHKRLWQRNYYEHVIRDEADLNRIRDYIQSNPANWDEDEENSNFKKS